MRYLGPVSRSPDGSLVVDADSDSMSQAFGVACSVEEYARFYRVKWSKSIGSAHVGGAIETPNWQENFEECLIAMIPLERRIQLLQESLIEAMEGGAE